MGYSFQTEHPEGWPIQRRAGSTYLWCSAGCEGRCSGNPDAFGQCGTTKKTRRFETRSVWRSNFAVESVAAVEYRFIRNGSTYLRFDGTIYVCGEFVILCEVGSPDFATQQPGKSFLPERSD